MARFLSRYLNGSLLYKRKYNVLKKNLLSFYKTTSTKTKQNNNKLENITSQILFNVKFIICVLNSGIVCSVEVL